VAARLSAALSSLPDDVRGYKDLATVADQLAELVRAVPDDR